MSSPPGTVVDVRDASPLDDVVLLAVAELDAATWRDAARRADVRLELEEDLTRQARGRGRRLGDRRREQTEHYHRHRYTDVDGHRREWLELVPAGDGGHLVKVTRVAMAYRPRP